MKLLKQTLYIRNNQDLSMKKLSLWKLFLPFALLAILSLYIGVKYSSNITILTSDGTYAISHENAFNEKLLKGYIQELNIPFPEIVFAQAKLESGNFKGRIFLENHNLFGMKKPSIRSTTAKGEQYNHAYYNSWKESVLDYALWSCKYLSNIKTKEQYLDYLANNYAEDTLYVKKIRSMIK